MKREKSKLPSDLVSDIKTRLKTLGGQINGIVKMLDEGRDPEQINIQFKWNAIKKRPEWRRN